MYLCCKLSDMPKITTRRLDSAVRGHRWNRAVGNKFNAQIKETIRGTDTLWRYYSGKTMSVTCCVKSLNVRGGYNGGGVLGSQHPPWNFEPPPPFYSLTRDERHTIQLPNQYFDAH